MKFLRLPPPPSAEGGGERNVVFVRNVAVPQWSPAGGRPHGRRRSAARRADSVALQRFYSSVFAGLEPDLFNAALVRDQIYAIGRE